MYFLGKCAVRYGFTGYFFLPGGKCRIPVSSRRVAAGSPRSQRALADKARGVCENPPLPTQQRCRMILYFVFLNEAVPKKVSLKWCLTLRPPAARDGASKRAGASPGVPLGLGCSSRPAASREQTLWTSFEHLRQCAIQTPLFSQKWCLTPRPPAARGGASKRAGASPGVPLGLGCSSRQQRHVSRQTKRIAWVLIPEKIGHLAGTQSGIRSLTALILYLCTHTLIFTFIRIYTPAAITGTITGCACDPYRLRASRQSSENDSLRASCAARMLPVAGVKFCRRCTTTATRVARQRLLVTTRTWKSAS